MVIGMKHLLFVSTLVILIAAGATAARQSEQPTGSIKGRITVEGKPQPGVVVSLFEEGKYYSDHSLARVITDADGYYRFTAIAAGRYSVSTHSPLFVNPEIDHNGKNGRLVVIDSGEAVEEINFSLVRGGVITGRVTDTEGRPVIALAVILLKADDRSPAPGFRTPDLQIMMTDDRGIYRIYGVYPGKYVVRVGNPLNMNRATQGGGRFTNYIQTFHPDATDRSKATVVEVTPGGETAGIDIKVGSYKKTYVATGRMIDAETGSPVPNFFYGIRLGEGGRAPIGNAYRTDERGEFRIELAVPSRVTIYPASDAKTNTTGKPFSFDLKTERVTGLEVKLNRAQTISGQIVTEGMNSTVKFSSLNISVRCISQDRAYPNLLHGMVREDGSFVVGGIVPGKISIYLNGADPSQMKPWLARVERNGVEQPQTFEIAEGESISDLRLVVAYGNGIVRGQVKFEGLSVEEKNLLDALIIFVGLRHTSAAKVFAGAQLDTRGRFVAEGLLDGLYEITLRPQRGLPDDQASRDLLSRIEAFRQTVTVTGGAETPITLLLDLSEKK